MTGTLRGLARTSALLPAIVTVLLLVGVGWATNRSSNQQGDPTSFIKAGSDFAHGGDMLPAGTPTLEGTGYDGQFYFYLAQDPFLTNGGRTEQHLDHVSYRYQRILFPLVAWAVSGGGSPDVLAWVLPALNLLAMAALGFVLARFLVRRGASPWWALLATLSLGQVVGFVNDLADPFALSLFLIGLICWAENRTTAALLTLTAAPFAREIYVLPVALVALIEIARWRRRGLVWLLPLAAIAAWNVYLRTAFTGSPSGADVEKPSAVPLGGAISKIDTVLKTDVAGAANWEVAFIVLTLALWVYLLVVVVELLLDAWRSRAWPSRADLAALVGFSSVVLIPFLTAALWRNPLSYARYAAAGCALLVIVYAVRRRPAALVVAGVLFTVGVVNPVVPMLPTHLGPVLKNPQPPPIQIPGTFGG